MKKNGIIELAQRMKDLQKRAIYVGVPKEKNTARKEKDGNGEPIKMAELAIVHEYGSPARNIPERSFLRAMLTKNHQLYSSLLFESLFEQTAIDVACKKVAYLAEADVKAYIRQGNFAPLKQATIKRKKSSKPLIDTGDLRNSIVGVVRDEN